MCRRYPERRFPSAITLQWSWDFWYRNKTCKLSDWHFKCSIYGSFKRKVYFAAVGVVGGLYVCRNLSSLEVHILLKNNSTSCVEIRILCEFENGIAFTDLGDRKVKLFCPAEKTVKTLLGSGQEGASDGTDETCPFTQVHGICSSDVAAGTIKLVLGLSGTVSFLQALGSLIL